MSGGCTKAQRPSPLSFIYDKGHLREVIEMYNPRCLHSIVFYEPKQTAFVVGGVGSDGKLLKSCEGFIVGKKDWNQYAEMTVARAEPGVLIQ